MGVTGLETAFAALHTELVLPGLIDLGLLVERMGGGAEPFGIERPSLARVQANVALCDLGAEWTVGRTATRAAPPTPGAPAKSSPAAS